jgi:hypothetical protein
MKPVMVYPTLPPGNFLPGVPAEGAEVAPELAAEWEAAGLVSLTPIPEPADPAPTKET